MKRFLAGVLVGLFGSGLAVWAQQHRASERVVEPQMIVDNAKVRMVRWVLRPGEGTPVHTHSLDHIAVVIHGSTLHVVDADGTTKDKVEKTGDAAFDPASGHTHSLANAGKTTFELITIELK